MPAVSSLRRPIIISHTIDFDGELVTFTFDRNKLTDAWVREQMRLEEEQEIDSMNAGLADLIESWDVVNDDGTPFPPTAENIGFLFSFPNKGLIIREFMTAAVPSRAEGNASHVPSNTEPSVSAPPAPMSLNGPAPSPSPQPSASPSTT